MFSLRHFTIEVDRLVNSRRSFSVALRVAVSCAFVSCAMHFGVAWVALDRSSISRCAELVDFSLRSCATVSVRDAILADC